jgi:hypothetical protein
LIEVVDELALVERSQAIGPAQGKGVGPGCLKTGLAFPIEGLLSYIKCRSRHNDAATHYIFYDSELHVHLPSQ